MKEVDAELLDLVSDATEHQNRFVREMSYQVLISAIVMQDLNLNTQLASKVSALVAKGLSDNWSQVRMSASQLVRNFCQGD